MKLLFLSRAYPPVIGGLENHNYELYNAIKQNIPTDAIINKKGKKALPLFLPFCAIKTLYLSSTYDAILLGDGILSCIGWLIKLFRPSVLVICIVHGLDITYENRVYKNLWVGKFLPKMDKVITVSNATSNAAIERGIEKSKLVVIPNGINPPYDIIKKNNNKQLEKLLQTSCQGKTILLTIGRLVKRKGVHWFINHVMPNLNERFIYIIVGSGPEKDKIDSAITKNNLENRVFCLGFVANDTKSILYSSANLFIQPNIKVKGDMEGFGISVLEANIHGLPVVGSKIEGLEDSIIQEQNGWLIEPENQSIFINTIEEVTKSKKKLYLAGQKAKAFCLKHFCWNTIADRYTEILLELQVETNEHKRGRKKQVIRNSRFL